jgi:hypothetical protein
LPTRDTEENACGTRLDFNTTQILEFQQRHRFAFTASSETKGGWFERRRILVFYLEGGVGKKCVRINVPRLSKFFGS